MVAKIQGICRFADRASNPPCKKHCKYNVFMQNAAKRRFWDHTMWGGGGGSEPRTGNIYAFALICASVFQNTSGVLSMLLYTVLTQQWEPGRRTVDANLKSGTIEVLHNPQRLLSRNRIGSSAPGSQQQLGRIWQQHKRCPKWFPSKSMELQVHCVYIL